MTVPETTTVDEQVASDPFESVVQFVAAAQQTASQFGRRDLAERLETSLARLSRPSTFTCVVGEFKQGKSSLVNALLGGVACPVDDDLATSTVTVVGYGDTTKLTVHRRQEGRALEEEIAPSQLEEFVTERGNPDNAKGVERVEITLRNGLLARGVTLVDSPGMNSLGSGSAAATLAFLPYADALLFVSDASQELTAPEVDFLKRAAEACPTVLFCLTKTDLYPEWRRIAEIDAGHLQRAGLEMPIIPLSSAVRFAALEREDRELNAESGFPELLRVLDADVLKKAKSLAATRALQDARSTLEQLVSASRAELEVLRDPKKANAALADLEAAKSHLEYLKGTGSRWSTVLADGIADLSNEATHALRGHVRHMNKTMDDRVETLESAEDWEALAQTLQEDVAKAVGEVFSGITTRAEKLRSDVVDVLSDDSVALSKLSVGSPVDVRSLWSDRSIAEKGGVAGKLTSGMQVVRGAQGGLMMLGMMGRFVPGAAAAVLLSNPVTIGIGVLFVGQAIVAQRKKRIAAQRQQAKQASKQFLDEVQFEVGNEMAEVIRTIQRQMRDEFSARVTELHRTYSEAAQRAQESAKQSEAARKEQLPKLEQRVSVLDGLLATMPTEVPA